MTFAADFEKLGKVENHELKPGGAEIPVTEENKAEYIKWVSRTFEVWCDAVFAAVFQIHGTNWPASQIGSRWWISRDTISIFILSLS